MIDAKVEGLAELNKALQQLPKELHKGPLRAAVGGAASAVQKQARANAPENEGTLKRAIYRSRSKSGSNAQQETAIVGVRFGRRYRRRGVDAWYWRFIEFGTALVAAMPFLRPAFESTKQQQIEAMRKRLAKGIERAAKKLARNPR